MNYACKLSELVKLNKCNSSGKNLLVLDLFQKSSDIRRLDFFLLKNRNTILEVTGIALHINLNFQYFFGSKVQNFFCLIFQGQSVGYRTLRYPMRLILSHIKIKPLKTSNLAVRGTKGILTCLIHDNIIDYNILHSTNITLSPVFNSKIFKFSY